MTFWINGDRETSAAMVTKLAALVAIGRIETDKHGTRRVYHNGNSWIIGL